jgi:putative membrane protein
MRNLKDYILLSLKGIAMGAADVVPGVSGGTIAFITGIYEELLETINSVNFSALKKLKSEGLKSFWKHINGNFILALFLGIGISIVSLAKLITYLLDHHSVLLWSFFFGLIISSIYLVGKTISKWDISKIVGLIIGTGISYYITILPPMENPDALWFVFLSGAIAICAMILPGISGSFILLLLGSYELILSAIKDMKLTIIGVFALGCLTGLLSFSKLLNWMFKKFHDLTIAILTGFLLGSLNKVWPWKETISTRINSHDKVVPFIQENVLPNNYIGENQLVMAILMAIIGLSLILVLEKVASKN